MSQLYDKAREKFLTGDLNWSSGGDTFKAVLINIDSYTTPDFANATDVTIELAGCFVESFSDAVTLSVDTNGGGTAVIPSGSTTFSSVGGSDDVQGVVIFESASNQPVAFIDSGTNLPVSPNGGDITVVWNNGTGEVFKL